MERPSLYRDIHKAIRALMGELVARAGTTDFEDAAAVAALRTATIDAFALLESHAAHEDRWIAPRLASHAPEVARELEAAHVDQHERCRALLAMLVDEERAALPGWTRGHAFCVALSRFAGELLTHMADEEERAMPALWGALPDAEIEAIHHAILAEIPPPEMMASLRWILPSIRHRDRVQMLIGARAAMPAPAFAGVLALARSVLAPRDHEALERSLGIARAA